MSGIIVGVDGSSHSIQALEWAMKEAALRQTAVTVLTVNTTPANPWTGNPAVQDTDPAHEQEMRKAAEELARKAASQIGDAQPTSVTVRAITGFPAKELVEASHDGDLVVVGSRGAGGFARLVMGSVSGQVVAHAHCPAVVIPAER
jgi:nucleotide-binding universal stress UspA family protein